MVESVIGYRLSYRLLNSCMSRSPSRSCSAQVYELGFAKIEHKHKYVEHKEGLPHPSRIISISPRRFNSEQAPQMKSVYSKTVSRYMSGDRDLGA